MDDFRKKLLAGKRVSVWGIGYLGYTSVLLLQEAGYTTVVHSLENDVLEALEAGQYPGPVQRHGWSRGQEIPGLDMTRLQFTRDSAEMFSSQVHIFAFPSMDHIQPPERLTRLFEVFVAHADALNNALVLFMAAEMPGAVERYFAGPLRLVVPGCSFAAAMRLDWTLEEFLCQQIPDVVAGHDQLALDKAMFFMNSLRRQYTTLASLKDAEIHVAAARALQILVTAFFNQLSLAYPGADIARMAPELVAGLARQPLGPSLATLGGRFANSLEFLMEGSAKPGVLTTIQAARSANLSFLLEYAEILHRQGARSVAIFGVSVTENQKNAMMSPAFVLAEHLYGLGMKVFLNDPHFSSEELQSLVPFATPLALDDERTPDALVFLTEHKRYRQLTRRDFDRAPFSGAKIIVDNSGMFREYCFDHQVCFHIIGNGTLGQLL